MLCGTIADWIGDPFDYPLDELQKIRDNSYDLNVFHRGKYYLPAYVQERRNRAAKLAAKPLPKNDLTCFPTQ